jgi:hypothetical protein
MDINTLACWMAADFSNQAQAFNNPFLFAHIRVCMRPLPLDLLSGVSLFLEQAYDYNLNAPYRVRVLKLLNIGDRIEIENYVVKSEEKFYGASRNPQLLQTLTRDSLEKLSGCNMTVGWSGKSFKGKVALCKGCIVFRNGQETYLDSTFEIDEEKFISLDQGLDLYTDELIWGSVAGPFQFVRLQSFADFYS